MKHTYKEKFKKDLIKEVKQSIELFLNVDGEDYGPTWCDPYVSLDHGGRGLYISLTEEDEFSKLLTWKKFIHELHYSIEFKDSNAAKKHLKNINVIVEYLKQEIKNLEEHEKKTINK